MMIWKFVKGMVGGLLATGFTLPLLLWIGPFFTSPGSLSPAALLLRLWQWIEVNLGYSIFCFAGLALLAMVLFVKLNRQLNTQADRQNVEHSLQKLDLTINLFIGIGVVFTAIGLRDCLISTLGGMASNPAPQTSAFEMMAALINNGLLVALTSTIVGAIGGYLFKAAKSWLLGKKINQYMATFVAREQAHKMHYRTELTALLVSIERQLKQGTKPGQNANQNSPES